MLEVSLLSLLYCRSQWSSQRLFSLSLAPSHSGQDADRRARHRVCQAASSQLSSDRSHDGHYATHSSTELMQRCCAGRREEGDDDFGPGRGEASALFPVLNSYCILRLLPVLACREAKWKTARTVRCRQQSRSAQLLASSDQATTTGQLRTGKRRRARPVRHSPLHACPLSFPLTRPPLITKVDW